jgi:hypothetical protein
MRVSSSTLLIPCRFSSALRLWSFRFHAFFDAGTRMRSDRRRGNVFPDLRLALNLPMAANQGNRASLMTRLGVFTKLRCRASAFTMSITYAVEFPAIGCRPCCGIIRTSPRSDELPCSKVCGVYGWLCGTRRSGDSFRKSSPVPPTARNGSFTRSIICGHPAPPHCRLRSRRSCVRHRDR